MATLRCDGFVPSIIDVVFYHRREVCRPGVWRVCRNMPGDRGRRTKMCGIPSVQCGQPPPLRQRQAVQ
eukprot:178106-Chlamydomonas_euryale.AAC.8